MAMLFFRWLAVVAGTSMLLDLSDLGRWVNSRLAITTAFFYGIGILFAAWYFLAPPRKLIEHTDRGEALCDFIGTAVLSSGMIGIPILMLMRLKWAVI